MDFPTHLRLGIILGWWVEKNYSIKILSPSFLWGCIEPDYEHILRGISAPKKRHTYHQDGSTVISKLITLSNKRKFNSDDLFELGQMMHYLMDFYCFAHNVEYNVHPLLHLAYEKQMGLKSIFLYSALFTNDEKQIDINSDNLSFDILINRLHEKYLEHSYREELSLHDQMIRDVSYACVCCASVLSLYFERCHITVCEQWTKKNVPEAVYSLALNPSPL